MKKKSYPLSKIYHLLEPGPTVMITTARGEEMNVMTMAWLTPMEFTPALIGCVVSDMDYSFEILKQTKECVISIPTVQLAATVVKVGNTTGKKIDKFEKFGLSPMPAKKVKAPLIAECYANIECKVVDETLVDKYSFFILEAVQAWVDPTKKNPKMIHHIGEGRFIVDGKQIKFPWRFHKR